MARPGLVVDRLVAVFLLGVLLLTPPFLGIFNSPTRVLGIPLLYLYLFAAWILLIGIVALTVEGSGSEDDLGFEREDARAAESSDERAAR
jgi:hypothetical protein